MFMISGVITLLGVISLSRLPVDLMPEFEQPTLNVRTSYPGVGPLEIEELITRPMEQAVSAVPGITRVESSSSEGNSQIRLNFEWGSDLSEAADEVRTRVDRMRNRLPEDADPPTIFKFDSNALPVMRIGIEGQYDPVTLRDVTQNEIAPRFERVDGVAAVTVNGGVRREIHVDLSKEKITALNLSVTNVVQALRQENQNTPLGELIASHVAVSRQGGQLKLAETPGRVADLLGMAGLADLFPLFDSVDDAVKSLPAPGQGQQGQH
jgi:HAE1 family hydrophobic/amphiphilic exporter-1